MNGRTYKLGRTCIELRAYLDNTTVSDLQDKAVAIAFEMGRALHDSALEVDHEKLQIASNRAGLHLAHIWSAMAIPGTPEDSLTLTLERMSEMADKLKHRGWNESKGN